jgi:AbiV family abortive infection protein
VKPKAIGDLAQLGDTEFFTEVAQGLRLIARSALRLEDDAQLLAQGNRARGCQILSALAEEEAAKYLILIDAVRCPRSSPHRGRQLAKFNQHLAKGLYAEAAMLSPNDFGELARYVARERREYYLDGDGEADWVCRNSILQRRETHMYVDFVDTDDGHSWEIAIEDALGLPALHSTRSAVTIALALDAIGCSEPPALSVISDVWRSVSFDDDTRWSKFAALNRRTIEQLDAGGFLRSADPEAIQLVLNRWPFPMHTLDMSLIKNKASDLRGVS